MEPYFYCKYGGIGPICSDCKRNPINSPYKISDITTWLNPSHIRTNGTGCTDYIPIKKSTMGNINEKLKQILEIYEDDENRFGGYTAIERFHDSAPEDYIESRTDWNTLRNYADDMYYMLYHIKTLIENCKELL